MYDKKYLNIHFILKRLLMTYKLFPAYTFFGVKLHWLLITKIKFKIGNDDHDNKDKIDDKK